MSGMHAATGQPLDKADHIAQSVADILTTPLNSRIARRDYGSVIPDLIDQPLTKTTLLKLYAASATALMTWEPRLRVTAFKLQISSDGTAIMDIEGEVNGAAFGSSVPLTGASHA